MAALATTAATDELAARILLGIVAIVIVARAFGALLQRFGQPAVIGELMAGIALGPTLLGALPGDPTAMLFPTEARPTLSAIGTLGLILFVFLVGLEIDFAPLKRRRPAALTIALSSVAVPFGLGIALALALRPGHGGGPFLPLALFIGTAVSVTALPVLARLLVDQGLQRTQLGGLALTCATIQDGVAWTLLAIALAVAGSGGVGDLVRIAPEMLAFVGLLWLVVRPSLRRLLSSPAPSAGVSPRLVTVAMAGAGLSAYATHVIGLHFVLGALLFGAAFPRERRLVTALDARLGPLTMSVLLPISFAVPGLGLNLRELGIDDLQQLVLIVAVACVGKFVGAGGAARALGMRWREATAFGALMNTRGLMELVVLNIGLAAGILDAHLYGLFVMMAIVTTLMAAPILSALYPAAAQPGRFVLGTRTRRGWRGGTRPVADTA